MAENYIDLKFIADTTQLEKAEAVADRLESRINKLVAQEAKGRITTEQYSASIRRMSTEMQKAAGGTIQARNAVLQYSRDTYQAAESMRQMAAAAQMSQKAMHQKGVVTQQVGYQVGDLLVQVQSGTNFFVAFGQQATQLVGVLGMLNPKLIGLSAGLGIAIPLVTALAAMMSRSSEATKDAEKDLRSYSKAAQTASEKVAQLRLEEEARAANQRDTTAFLLEQGVKQAELELKLAKEAMNTSMEETGVLQAQINAAAETLKIRKELLENYNKELDIAEQRKQQEERVEEAQDRAKERLDAYINSMADLFRSVQAGYQAVAQAQTTVNSDTEAYITKMSEVFKTSQELRKELGDAAFEALRLSGVDMVSGVDAAAKAAARLAADLGVSLSAALQMQAMTSKEDLAMSQPVVQGSALDRYDVETLLGMGYTKEYLTAMGKIKSDRTKAGGGTSDSESRLESLMNSLMTEQEQVEEWRNTQLELLKEFNDKELELIGGKEAAAERIRNEYSARLIEAKQRESELVANSSRGMYNELAGLLNMFAGKSKAAAIASIALTKGLRIAEIISSGAAAQVRALAELGPILGPPAAAKIGLFSKIQAGIVAATGLAQAASLGSGGGAGISSGGSVSGSAATIPASSEGTGRPTRVIIEGIDRNSLITGEQLANIFDQLYKENEDRGFVFEVAQ